MSSSFVISKTELDFEGYPQNSEVVDIQPTLEEAQKAIEKLPKPTLCHCKEHDDFSYDIKEIKK